METQTKTKPRTKCFWQPQEMLGRYQRRVEDSVPVGPVKTESFAPGWNISLNLYWPLALVESYSAHKHEFCSELPDQAQRNPLDPMSSVEKAGGPPTQRAPTPR